jgi:hypothetical protein
VPSPPATPSLCYKEHSRVQSMARVLKVVDGKARAPQRARERLFDADK